MRLYLTGAWTLLAYLLHLSVVQAAAVYVFAATFGDAAVAATIAGVFLLVNTVLTIYLTRKRNGG